MSTTYREYIEGTHSPRIHIFRRMITNSQGEGIAYHPWHAEWCIDGRQRRKTLGTTNKSAAKLIAIQIWKELQSGINELPSRNITIEQIWTGYLKTQRSRVLAPKTIQKYELVQRNFLNWAGIAGKSRAAKLIQDDLYNFRNHMINDLGVREKTAYDRVVIVQQAMKWACRQLLIRKNPFAGMPFKKPESSPQPCFTPEQVGSVFVEANEPYRSIFKVLALTGMRIGELSQLQWSDVHFDDKELYICRGGSRPNKTKTGRSRSIPMHDTVIEVLSDLFEARHSKPKPTDLVFHGNPGKKYPEGGPVTEKGALGALKATCRRCGFENPEQYKLHTFRHFYASILIRNGTHVIEAEKLMGHKSSDMLRRYVTMFNDSAQKAIDSIQIPTPERLVSDSTKKKKKQKEGRNSHVLEEDKEERRGQSHHRRAS